VGSTTVVTGTAVSSTNQSAGTLVGPATATRTTGKAITGAATITSNGGYIVALTESKLIGTTNPAGWTATGVVVSKASATDTITAYVVCG
jgi:hypothetical protein